MEQSLGTTLFTRRPRGIALTPAGELLADYAGRIFALAADAESAIADLQGLRSGSLRLGVSPTIGVYFLPPLLVHFQRRFPQVQLHVEIEETELLEQRLRDGRLDLGLGPAHAESAAVRATPFMQEDFVAVAAPEFWQTRRRSITARQLAESFVARRLPSASGALVLGYFARRNIPLRPVLSLGSLEAVKQAVIAGLGMSVLPKMAVASDLQGRRLIALKAEGLPLRRPLYQLQRLSGASRAAIAFTCLLKHAVRGTLPRLATPGHRATPRPAGAT